MGAQTNKQVIGNPQVVCTITKVQQATEWALANSPRNEVGIRNTAKEEVIKGDSCGVLSLEPLEWTSKEERSRNREMCAGRPWTAFFRM